MTEWMSTGPVRHIPEEELHAYLDQALSRSQCVEIECHISECPACEQLRSRAAAVRDRTTALLAEAAPRKVRIPPFEQLVARRQEIEHRRATWISQARRGALLAAGLAASVGAGWWSRGLTGTRVGSATPSVPSQILSPRMTLALAEHEAGSAAEPLQRPAAHVDPINSDRSLVRVDRSTVPEGIVQVNAVAPDDEGLSFDGLWQTVDAQRAAAETGGNLPRIEGLPILEIQLQRGNGDERPTVVV